jgi:hypothetical protein
MWWFLYAASAGFKSSPIPRLYSSLRHFGTYFTIVWPCIVTDSFWIKPTDALNSNFIGITTLHVSVLLSVHHQEFLGVHRLWYILCSWDEPFATRSRMNCPSILLLVANGSSQLCSYCCLCMCILIVRPCILKVFHIFLLLSMYSYCCLCILIVRPCILIVVNVYLLLSTYS